MDHSRAGLLNERGKKVKSEATINNEILRLAKAERKIFTTMGILFEVFCSSPFVFSPFFFVFRWNSVVIHRQFRVNKNLGQANANVR